MKKRIEQIIFSCIYLVLVPIIVMIPFLIKKKKDTLVWGTSPLLNNKYWAEAMRDKGYKTVTLMRSVFSINRIEDFDLYFNDLVPRWIIGNKLRKGLGPFFAYIYIIRNARVIHMPYGNGPLGITSIWRMESWLYRLAGIKTIVIPYGSDSYMYSRINDKSLLNALLMSYPTPAKYEQKILRKVMHWIKKADIVINGFMGIDGFGRWDIALIQFIDINVREWRAKTLDTNANGNNGVVKIIHTPNHRGVKGTEFIINAVDELKREGYDIELILVENKTNEEVKALMQEADILAEQIIGTGYALSGIEGMATGLPVLSNLESEAYTRVFRRYSFLNECPIVSTTPENIKENLRILIENPVLRAELGQAGRQYVEKYHSYETAQYLFGSIYKKILDGEDIDLMNLFHPLKSAYNKSKPLIKHPLIENKLPDEYLKKAASEKIKN